MSVTTGKALDSTAARRGYFCAKEIATCKMCRMAILAVASIVIGTAHASTWYLAPDGSDSYDGTSSNYVSGAVGPMQSFEELMPKVAAGDTIVLMPGDHQSGTMSLGDKDNHTLSRVHVTKSNVTIRSYSGNPGDTAIVGWGIDSPDSLGDDKQVRCVSIYKNATGCVIEGVTLKNGVACYSSDSTNGRGLGGGVYDSSASCWLIGCVVTNCIAYAGGGVYGASAAGTRFIGCKGSRTAWGSAMYMGGTAAFCLFDRCEEVTSGGARTIGGDNAKTKVYNCTFVGAKRGVFYCKSAEGYTVVNSISVGNTDSNSASDSGVGETLITARRSVFTACVGTNEGSSYDDCEIGVTVGDVGFCNASADDWRVKASSVAATLGDAAELSAVALPAGYTLKDLYGRPVPSSGAIAAGCALAAPCIVLGNGVYDTGSRLTAGANDLPVEQPASYTLAVDENASARPVAGLAVNDEPVASDNPWTVVVGALPPGESVSVTAVAGTNWYVDVNNGDDSWNGGIPGRAKRSIRAATTNAIPGDVVHVAEGTYDAASEGEQIRGTHRLPQRVLVPNNVTVVADGRAEHTIICGAGSSVPEDDFGNGEGAVRCAFVGTGAVLRNFTLTGGHTRYTATGVEADRKGCAALGVGESSIVADCIVTGNCAFAGTLYNLLADHCVVKANKASNNAPGGETCWLYGCLFDENVGKWLLYGPKVINSCTIGSRNVDADGASDVILLRTNNGYAMTNSVMTCGKMSGSATAVNCALPKALCSMTSLTTNNCLFLDAADMPHAADGYVPTSESLLNNAGDPEFFPGCEKGFDLAGTPRVLNGGLDIGAFEHDWRENYSEMLNPRHVKVDGASPSVVAEDGAVSLNGGVLSGKFVAAGRSVCLKFAVTGAGVLKLYVDDALFGTYEAGTAPTEVIVRNDVDQGTFRFEHVLEPGEEGEAKVFRCAGATGLTVSIK